MSILVVGSVAFDTLETPSGKRERVLGGAATHFALAASFFTKVRVVGVVGDDFLPEHEAVLISRGVDTTGIEHVPGKSFHWTGSYMNDLAEADTLATDLNVFADFSPKFPRPISTPNTSFSPTSTPSCNCKSARPCPTPNWSPATP